MMAALDAASEELRARFWPTTEIAVSEETEAGCGAGSPTALRPSAACWEMTSALLSRDAIANVMLCALLKPSRSSAAQIRNVPRRAALRRRRH